MLLRTSGVCRSSIIPGMKIGGEYEFVPYKQQQLEVAVEQFARETGCLRLFYQRPVDTGVDIEHAKHLEPLTRKMARIKLPSATTIWHSKELLSGRSDPRRLSNITAGTLVKENEANQLLVETVDLGRRVPGIANGAGIAGQALIYLRPKDEGFLKRIGIEFDANFRPYTTKFSYHYPLNHTDKLDYHSRSFDDVHIYLQNGHIAPVLGRKFVVSHRKDGNRMRILSIEDENRYMRNLRKVGDSVQQYDWSNASLGWHSVDQAQPNENGSFTIVEMPENNSPFAGGANFYDEGGYLKIVSDSSNSVWRFSWSKQEIDDRGGNDFTYDGENFNQAVELMLKYTPSVLSLWKVQGNEVTFG